MTNLEQHRGWISGMRLRAASAALAFVVVLGLEVVTTQSAQAQTFTVLYNFNYSSSGGNSHAGLVRDASGNLYGTTYVGGANGAGTVFKVDTSDTLTVLHSFTGGTDGGYPYAGLVQDTKGNLYGGASLGGSSHQGVVFKVDTSDTLTVLYSFTGGTMDGCGPGGLVRDSAGNLYGTTVACGAFGYGTVFKLSKSGKETVLHNFAGGTADGAVLLYTGLLMDTAGNLYGVTYQGGGTGCGGHGCGTVFKLQPTGKETLLHRFIGGTTDGCYPFGTLVNDAGGNLYGTAEACGASSLGIVWKLSNKGTETVLHSFAGEDGVYPSAGVIMDAKGNLYGDTSNGGPSSAGVVYS
jgi:uncharacterized repeat protein (TIGR03803 family)